jgi:hypothetical protein
MSDARCKVDVVTERHDLDRVGTRYATVDERLLTRWTGADGNEPDGYRTLTAWFNTRLLRHVYDRHGRETTGSRVQRDYEALTGADELVREEVLDGMRADGIDAERVVDDMISWSTMRTHLKECLDGTKATRSAETDWERNSVVVAQQVTASKVDEALRSLDTKGRLPGGTDATVETQVLLSCPNCPTRIPFADAVERGFVCKDHLSTPSAVSD